jgi:5,10-methylenetetrahydromethanopterin reductase
LDAELGLHLPYHVLNRWRLPEVIDLVGRANALLRPFNFRRVWTNDSLEYRHVLVTSAAILARQPVKLGTAVVVPYVRNPIDLIAGIASLAELCEGQDVSLGLGAGAPNMLGAQVDRSKPVAMLSETIRLARQLLAGEEAHGADYPTLTDYFHLRASTYKLRFPVSAPVRVYYGGAQVLGPRLKREVLTLCDGAIVGTVWRTPADMARLMAEIETARQENGVAAPLRKVMHVNACVALEREQALRHAKRFVCHALTQATDEYVTSKGIDPAAIRPAREALYAHQGVDVAADLLPDEVVDPLVIAGTAAQCRERIGEWLAYAQASGFEQVMMGVPLGPDPAEAIQLWASEILPGIR